MNAPFMPSSAWTALLTFILMFARGILAFLVYVSQQRPVKVRVQHGQVIKFGGASNLMWAQQQVMPVLESKYLRQLPVSKTPHAVFSFLNKVVGTADGLLGLGRYRISKDVSKEKLLPNQFCLHKPFSL